MLAVDETGASRRRRSDHRDPRARARRRHGRGHVDDEPRLPPPDGGERHPRRHDRRRRPLRARGAAARGRDPRRRAVGPHPLARRARHRRRPRRRAPPLPRARRAGGSRKRPRSCRASRRSCGTCRAPGAGRSPTRSSRRSRPSTRSSPAAAAVSSGRPGTEPVVRVLAEAESEEEAERLCASLAALVTHELG